MKKCFSTDQRGAVIGIFLGLTAAWPSRVHGQYIYDATNREVIITGYVDTGPIGALTIPGAINGLPVTRIAARAFRAQNTLTSVTIPGRVASIGESAFEECSSLANCTIPNSVTEIGDCALAGCRSLTGFAIPNSVTRIGSFAFTRCTGPTNITIPGSVTSIGDSAFADWFADWTNLTTITVDPLNFAYCSVDGVLFNKNQTTLIQCPEGKAGAYTIPNSVTNIADLAFSGCANLTGITIPNQINGIGGFAFNRCAGLTTVTIPANVFMLNGAAFYYCTRLSEFYFEGNAPTLGVGVFDGDLGSTIYYLPGTWGWDSTFGGLPTAPWLLANPIILSDDPRFGVRSNCFGFMISWATNTSVVVEASTDLANHAWPPVATNTLVGGLSYFWDLQWKNFHACFHRLRSP